MPNTHLAFALAGLGGFNVHGAGFLQAARDHGVKPDLVTATSGQIVVLAAFLEGREDLRKGLIDEAITDDPLSQVKIALFGYPGVFEPAGFEAIQRMLMPPALDRLIDIQRGMTLREAINFFADRFLPAQLYKPSRSAEIIAGMAETFNASETGVVFNAFDPASGEGVLYGNDAARAAMESETAIGFAQGQASADMRFGKADGQEQALQPITSDAIESALWLTLYGFGGMPHGQIDGAYHRSSIVSELHNFDRIVVCRPLAHGWGRELPQNYFDVQDWNTEMWFSVGYKAEVDAMKRINRLVEQGKLDGFKFVEIYEVTPDTPAGYFNYFIERESVFEDARAKAGALFDAMSGWN